MRSCRCGEEVAAGPESAGRDDGEPIRVALQRRRRFLREGVATLLAAEDDVVVTGTAVTVSELVELCTVFPVDVAIVDFTDDLTDAVAGVALLRREMPKLRLVAVCDPADAERAASLGAQPAVGSTGGLTAILDAVRRPACSHRTLRVAGSPPRQVLTPRETAVLALVGEGCTTWEVADRLGISRKTVENHKQRIFTKLDVQNQAHAVAVAVRQQLISVGGVPEVANEA